MKKNYNRKELNQKIQALRKFANWGVTSFVIIMFLVYLASDKKITIWVVLTMLLVVISTAYYCVMGLIYNHKLKQLDK
ncbi:hypothetical protein GSH19_00305 [Lactobacillus sp. S2-2]|uniref:DUF2614 family zinc ribbon-containing protein n=1 Tax=Lactobacillus sp. S2-2 TaxID=2692917 RepID=UPI001F349240|nr:DUF2614 family zinc ribbon-containing protein [Lactobacillus sp. S2-2]MCF6514627.1 hypothetical protein [Lactobacillus sp. S2-2]